MRRVIDQWTEHADHLALDEAMLQQTDEGGLGELMRVWEFNAPVVVLGRSSRVDVEVDRSFCEQNGIPILRRASGGAAVVAGPGCLMYSIVLSFQGHPELQKIDVAHRHVMTRILKTVRQQLPDTMLQGICDLTWHNRKCSGNSLRIARRHLLYHGTILYDFDLELLARCLTDPPRQPEYRCGRQHHAFVTNVAVDPNQFATELCRTFAAIGEIDSSQFADRMIQLRQQRYDSASWHFRH